MPSAPITMTQRGMATSPAEAPNSDAWTMAARGPTALATSLAPCAKESSAAETMSGRAKSVLSERLRFSSPRDWRRTSGTVRPQQTSPPTSPISSAVPMSIWITRLRPFSDR